MKLPSDLDSASGPMEAPDIKHIPAEEDVRALLRRHAAEAAKAEGWMQAPDRPRLERVGSHLLECLGLPEKFLGFTMVALNNAFWHDAFASVPLERRLLLLPHCLRDEGECQGTYDSEGLHCAGCGRCKIHELKESAEALGYRVIIAEGTGAVVKDVLDDGRDAVLGVACLDSLEKSFARVESMGLPHLAVPLISNGCRGTSTDLSALEAYLTLKSDRAAMTPLTFVPLLREAGRLFEPDALGRLLEPYLNAAALAAGEGRAFSVTERLAHEWLKMGGRRFRPFVTLAAYAVGRHGSEALSSRADLGSMIPLSVRRLALAIEVLHKASLVHDDIEDDSEFRYGEPTLHRAHGVAAALNVGDYLVGLGYRLVVGEGGALGAACVTDILDRLTAAHLELCRGQGAELSAELSTPGGRACEPLDVLAIGALKTAPAFEAALAAGLRAADVPLDGAILEKFSGYLGEGYQILNDLEDWTAISDNKVIQGQDVRSARPTILRAFALKAGAAAELERAAGAGDSAEAIERTRRAYKETGAFQRTEELLRRLRARALAAADEIPGESLRELFKFLVRVLLEPRETS